MRRIFILSVALCFGVVFAAAMIPACAQPKTKTISVTIGTGPITGVYYPTGGAIAKIVKEA